MKKSLIALAALAATSAFAQSSVTLYGRAEAGVDLGYSVKTTGTTSGFSVVGGVVAPGAFSSVAGSSNEKPGFRVQDGQDQGQGSSRFGFRGTEDLGGGLKANFVMEAGVSLDDGVPGRSGGNLFGRAAWVGLSGGFGEVRLGRQVLGSFGVHANGLSGGAASGLYEVGANIVQGGVRFSNAIQYRSPDFGGISGTISLRAPEGQTSSTAIAGANPDTTDTKVKSGVDLSIAYANGPIYVGFGYNRTGQSTTFNNNEVSPANISNGTDSKVTDYAISASYNLGVAQPFFSYVNRKNVSSTGTVAGVNFTNGSLAALAGSQNAQGSGALGAAGANAKTRQYAFGVKVPLGAATLLASFANAKTTGSGSASNQTGVTTANEVEAKTRAFQIGAQYPLSKRTMLQANYGINNTKTATATVTPTGVNSFSVVGTTGEVKVRALNFGVQHLF